MNIDLAFSLLMQQEGISVTNISGDKGGLTKFGIAQKFHPNIDVASLTKEQAETIYLNEYWNPGKCSELPNEIMYAHFSCAVNCGIGAAIKILQRACKVADDGICGPATLGAAKSVSLAEYCSEWQLKYDNIIKEDPSQVKFEAGWKNRIEKILEWAKEGKLAQ